MSDHWRVFLGLWDDPTFAAIDETYPTYGDAAERFDGILGRWRADSCDDCRAWGTKQHDRFLRLPDGGEFACQVEGDDYVLIRADRGDLDDLLALEVAP